VARPRATDEGDELSQKSRITAFVVNDRGEPSVECWEINNMVETKQVKRTDGSKANAHALPLTSGNELDGVDILTWPSSSYIWPPQEGETRAQHADLSEVYNLFSVQQGLIDFVVHAAGFGRNSVDEEVEPHIFSGENGDDWFYFEDNYTDSSNAKKSDSKPYPFSISTISATETELLRLRFSERPNHRVVHKGACRFTGIKTPESSHGVGKSSSQSPLTVQVNIQEAL